MGFQDELWSRFFPGLEISERLTDVSSLQREFLDLAKPTALSCISLLGRAMSPAPLFRLTFESTGLPLGESVQIGVAGDPSSAELAADGQPASILSPLAPGSGFSIEVRRQPSTAACDVTPASGVLDADLAIAVHCEPASAP